MTAHTPIREPDAMVDTAEFRAGMRRLASGVSLITTAEGIERWGMIATAVCSISLEPPTLMVSINRSASAFAAIARTGTLCVNLLGEQHADLVAQFSSPERRAERFSTGIWHNGASGAPVLADALAAFDCRVVKQVPYSTHVLFLAVPAAVTLGDDANRPLVHFDRGFVGLP